MKTKKTITESSTESRKVYPMKPQGTITFGGKKIKIGMDTVPHSEGIPSDQLIKKLKDTAKKNLFPLPALMVNE